MHNCYANEEHLLLCFTRSKAPSMTQMITLPNPSWVHSQAAVRDRLARQADIKHCVPL